MNELHFSFQNVIDGNGIGLALTGMTIVFCALGLISLIITALPGVLKFLPPPAEHHGVGPATPPVQQTDDALIAAIAYTLHTRQQQSGA
jgi:Na+-transporting methylmalonyl-CoA/oxaloacetate decarboxylase gamma subunit